MQPYGGRGGGGTHIYLLAIWHNSTQAEWKRRKLATSACGGSDPTGVSGEGCSWVGSPVKGQPPIPILQVHSSPFLQQCHHHIRVALLSSTEEGSVLVLIEGIEVE